MYANRVGIVIPNGAELAVCVMGVLSHWCAIPIAGMFLCILFHIYTILCYTMLYYIKYYTITMLINNN